MRNVHFIYSRGEGKLACFRFTPLSIRMCYNILRQNQENTQKHFFYLKHTANVLYVTGLTQT